MFSTEHATALLALADVVAEVTRQVGVLAALNPGLATQHHTAGALWRDARRIASVLASLGGGQ